MSELEQIAHLAKQYDADEAFETGRQRLRQWLPTKAVENYDLAGLQALSSQLDSQAARLAFYWFAYFTARIKIEQSYDFLQAFELLDLGQRILQSMAQPEAVVSECDQLYAYLMVQLVDIDRGIHNNDFLYAMQAAQRLLDKIDAHPDCQAAVATEKAYLQVMYAVAELLHLRDVGQDSPEQWQQVHHALQRAFDEMSATGLDIYASLLQAFLMAFPTWQQAGSNRLRVTRGRGVATYYATLDTMQTKGLLEALNDRARRQVLMRALGSETFYEPEPPDILSDISFQSQFHIWQFELPSIELPDFRGAGLAFDVTLRINSLGVLQLFLEVDIADMGVNALRHLMNLPSENAIDETVVWHHPDATVKVHYLREMAEQIFVAFDDWLDQNVTSDCLVRSVGTDVNMLLLVEAAADNEHTLLTPDAFYAHPDWKGLKVPPREVRSVYENWRMQQPHDGVKNLAKDLYHQTDWVQADGHYALIVQLDQPTWVTEQAVENVQVVTSLRYFMKQMGEMLFATVQRIERSYQDGEAVQHQPSKVLRALAQEMREKIEKLHEIELEVKTLLQLLDGEGLMRFPDHGRFVNQLVESTGVQTQRHRLQAILRESRSVTQYLKQQIDQALEQLKQRSRARFDGAVGFLGALISVSALSDIFSAMNAAGFDLGGMVQLEWMLGLMLAIAVYFVIEALIRKFK